MEIKLSTYVDFCLVCANSRLESEGDFKTMDVLLMYITGTDGIFWRAICRLLSFVAIIYLRDKSELYNETQRD